MPNKIEKPRKEPTNIKTGSITDEDRNIFNRGYNKCHDQFTAWLEGLDFTELIMNTMAKVNKESPEVYLIQAEHINTAIKTMILGGDNGKTL